MANIQEKYNRWYVINKRPFIIAVIIGGSAIIIGVIVALAIVLALRNGSDGTFTKNGCPPGYQEAVGTYYVSWPNPGSKECVANSGCKWAGLFHHPKLTAGPPQGPCSPGAKLLDGGDGTVRCRWPESVVSQWRLASTWENDSSLLNQQLEIFIQSTPQRKVLVNVGDVCSDADCDGCCSNNTGKGAYKLIDIEKFPVAQLLGISPTSLAFSDGTASYPTAEGLRPGAPESDVMPLCYRTLGQAVFVN